MRLNLFRHQVPEKVLETVVKMATQFAGRLDQLVRKLIVARTYEPEVVHQIRILTRKCSTAWQVLHQAGADIDKQRTIKGLRALRKHLGPLRDADIRWDELQVFVSKRKVGVDDDLAGAVQQSWITKYVETIAPLEQQWPQHRKTLSSLLEQCKRLNSSIGHCRWSMRDDRGVMKRLAKWSSHAEKLDANEEELHAFRIQTKRIRYLLQCLLPQRLPVPQRSWLTLLEELQQELGRRRDLMTIIEWLDCLQHGLALRDDHQHRLDDSINSWRKICVQTIKRQDKPLTKLRKQLTLTSKR